MPSADARLPYPRRKLIRSLLTGVASGLLQLFARVEIEGGERLPKHGPCILVGNHVGVLEAVLMAVYTPAMVEFIGNGDIPFDPRYAWIANAYGLIPINRGNLDRRGLQMGLDVLAQNGILGIFPEGGIWNPAQMEAQIGAAWLSYKSQAPLLPIGFGGVQGGLAKAVQLKRPRLTVRVGHALPPIRQDIKSSDLKAQLQSVSGQILEEIRALIPPDDLPPASETLPASYQLTVSVVDQGKEVVLPDELIIAQGEAYAHFLFSPTLQDVLARNLRLPIQPLRNVTFTSRLSEVIQGWQAITGYLEENPGFFTYRLGMDEGLAIKQALLALIRLGQWSQQHGYDIAIVPLQRRQNPTTGEEVIERGGSFPHSMLD